jgi:hypothetical protein
VPSHAAPCAVDEDGDEWWERERGWRPEQGGSLLGGGAGSPAPLAVVVEEGPPCARRRPTPPRRRRGPRRPRAPRWPPRGPTRERRSEGPEKATRGMVNESQSKFSWRNWHTSQNRSDAPLFQLDQDRTAIANLSAFGIGLETAMETRNGASKTTREIDDKNRLETSLSPLRHFTEHLVNEFVKLSRENDLNHKTSSFSIRQLKSNTGCHLHQSTHKNHRENETFIRRQTCLCARKIDTGATVGN